MNCSDRNRLENHDDGEHNNGAENGEFSGVHFHYQFPNENSKRN